MKIRQIIRKMLTEESQRMIDTSERAQTIYNDIVSSIRPRSMSEAEVDYGGGKKHQGFVFNLNDVLSQLYRELVGNDGEMLKLMVLSDEKLNNGSASFVPSHNLIILNTNKYLEDFDDVKAMIIKHKSSIIHELVHAWVYYTAKGKNIKNYVSTGDDIDTYTEYGNQPEEFNSYLTTAINDTIDEMNSSSYSEGYMTTYESFLKLVKRRFKFNFNLLSPRNKQRFNSKVYTTWDILKDKYVGDKYEEAYKRIKSELEDSYQKILKDPEDTIKFYIDFMDITNEKDAFFEAIGVRNNLIQGKNKQVLYALADKYWDRYQKEKPE